MFSRPFPFMGGLADAIRAALSVPVLSATYGPRVVTSKNIGRSYGIDWSYRLVGTRHDGAPMYRGVPHVRGNYYPSTGSPAGREARQAQKERNRG